MRWFRSKPKPTGPPPGMTWRDPFAAVPLVAPGVSVRAGEGADSDGLVLRRQLDLPTSRRGRLLCRLGLQRSAHLKLDRPGTFFWRQIDGVRDLAAIAAAVGRECRLSDAEARRATLLFTKNLMLRSFIQIRVASPPETVGAASPGPAPGGAP